MIKFEGTLEELLDFARQLVPGMVPAPSPPVLLAPTRAGLVELVKAARQQNNPIGCIKAIRNLAEGFTLKEAKDIYEEARGAS